ncbi:hypothetical protein M2284_003451 [Rhodococcus sp. LBL1]|nr:hypothetical protein [Rhodococcus sp. LBL1]MDH6685025.1 hypothetical protein [Rhodococcus sp. LBL2]
MILRRFLYLDESAVDGYLSALEDGLRDSVQRDATRNTTIGGSFGVSRAKLEAEKGNETTYSEVARDTPHSKYERLSRLAEEAGALTEVLEDDLLSEYSTGEIIELEADLYVPEAVRLLQSDNEVGQLFDAMDKLSKLGSIVTLEGMPPQEERDAMRAAISALPTNLMVVGELAESDWSVAGKLNRDYLHDADLDGTAKIVGKIAKKLPRGTYKPILALPGMSLIPREQRRAMERKKPEPADEGKYLKGPAVLLDIIAIYR